MDYRKPIDPHTVIHLADVCYYIEEIVGQGTVGIVYKGWYWDPLPAKRCTVLIKELFPFHPKKKIWRGEHNRIVVAPEDEPLWRKFLQAEQARKPRHSIPCNNTLYAVLESPNSRSLQDELNGCNVTLPQTVRWMLRLLEALEEYHSCDRLHLDIRPETIILTEQNSREQIILMDYNGAAPDSLNRRVGYAAPEVINGKSDSFDLPTDLYSVAAVFYRCLMGRPLTISEMLRPGPPAAQDSPLLQQVSRLCRLITARILRKGLHTLPQHRYRTADEMRKDFILLASGLDLV